MEFSPAFALLQKFTIGRPPTPKNEDDILTVARYLGVDFAGSKMDDRETLLSNELANQNRFLSAELSSYSIFDSDEYRKSMFVKEVVTNNRLNIKNRMARDRKASP